MKFKSLHHVDRETIREMYDRYAPVFVLSTGRSGSKFVASLLDCAPNVAAFHEPRPTLQYFSNYAFHNQEKETVLSNMIDAARMESILAIFIKEKIYLESNHCLTFFAPALANLFKGSKFIHLVRHPGDFVRSALRKGWHRNDSIWESGRVRMENQKEWDRMDEIEKLSWVWETTNRFIEEFKKSIREKRRLDLRIEALSAENDKMNELLSFVGAADIPREKIDELRLKRINALRIGPDEPPNMKKIAHFPEYADWDPGKKQKLQKYAGKLASQYGYDL